jgi:hypothetical protein
MKTFKTIDYIGQVVLVVMSVFVVVIFGFKFDGPGLNMYFFVGGWQVLSMIIHLFIDKGYKIRLRNVYIALLGLTVLVGLASLVSDFIIHFLVGLIVWSPVLAVIYLVCCYKEMQRMSETTHTAEQSV